MSRTANRIVGNTGYLYAKMGITMFVSLYTTRLVLNALGDSDFGIFNIIGGSIAMLGFLNGSMASATQRFMSYAEGEGNFEHKKKIFNISVVLHFAIAIIATIVFGVLYCFLFDSILSIPKDRIFAAKIVYLSLVLSVFFTIISVPYDAVLNSHENMKYFAIVGIVESLLKLIVAEIVCFTNDDKLIVYGFLMAGIPVVTMTIMRMYCKKKYSECNISLRRYWDKCMVRRLTSFALLNLQNSIVSILSNYGIGLVLNHFHGTISNAAQGVANQISGQLGVLGTSFKKAVNPVISKSAGASDYNKMIAVSYAGTKITFMLVTILFVPFMVDAEYILRLWLVKPPQDTKIFCVLLLWANVFQNLTLLIPSAIFAVGDIKYYSILSSVNNSFPIILTVFFFVVGFPPYYMYVSMIVSAIIKCAIDLYFGKIKCGVIINQYVIRVVLPLFACVTISMVVGLGIEILLFPSLTRLFLIIVFSCLCYVILFYFIALDREEKYQAKDVLLCVKKKFNERL